MAKKKIIDGSGKVLFDPADYEGAGLTPEQEANVNKIPTIEGEVSTIGGKVATLEQEVGKLPTKDDVDAKVGGVRWSNDSHVYTPNEDGVVTLPSAQGGGGVSSIEDLTDGYRVRDLEGQIDGYAYAIPYTAGYGYISGGVIVSASSGYNRLLTIVNKKYKKLRLVLGVGSSQIATTRPVAFYENGASVGSSPWVSDANVQELEVDVPPCDTIYVFNRTAALATPSVQTVSGGVVKELQSKVDEMYPLVHPSWEGKNVVLYGDSVTAQGNGDDDECRNSFLYYAYKELGFASLRCRGVGGQTFTWNDKGYYCEANGNGVYLGRYKYDADGTQTREVVVPSAITATDISNIQSAIGKQIEVHNGCFCSWDRVKSSIPSDVRESIDLIIICGGSNDFSAVEDITVDSAIVAEEPQWLNGNATDSAWANDATFYTGGDYDITRLSGAIASTIMKMQKWCPNALVVLATPYPHYSGTTYMQKKNSRGMTFRELCDIEKVIAGYVSTECIDANAQAGLTGAEFATRYTTDGTHPNAEGRKWYGRVFVGKLKCIAPRIL